MNVEKIITIKPHEEVLRVARNYWLVYLPQWIVAFFFIALAFFLMTPLFEYGKWGVGVFILLNCIGAWNAARTMVRWHWNAFIVTNLRVVDVDQRGFFDRVVSEAPIDKIQDLSYSVRGVIGTMFNFGSVSLQTAGSTATVDLANVRDPKELYHVIVDARAKRLGGHDDQQSDKVSSLLEAVGSLNEAEARAFVTSLKQAFKKNETPSDDVTDEGDDAPAPKKPSGERADLDKELEWFKDES